MWSDPARPSPREKRGPVRQSGREDYPDFAHLDLTEGYEWPTAVPRRPTPPESEKKPER